MFLLSMVHRRATWPIIWCWSPAARTAARKRKTNNQSSSLVANAVIESECAFVHMLYCASEAERAVMLIGLLGKLDRHQYVRLCAPLALDRRGYAAVTQAEYWRVSDCMGTCQ